MAVKGFLRRHATALLLVIVIGVLVGGAVGVRIVVHGVSARETPTFIEEKMARLLRHYAVPHSMRSL